MQTYQPGLHLLSSFAAEPLKLTAQDDCRVFFDQLILRLGLCKVGEAWHRFPNDGFTSVVALTESHVSLHTWPEYGLATFDVFLSNFLRDNENKVREFYAETLLFFEGKELNLQELRR